MSSPILAAQNITQRYGAFTAVNNVSVSFNASQLTAIIGPNGAGKSTLFNVLSGAFTPTGGRIQFNGADITGIAQHEFARRGIAKSFQITSLFPQLTARENVRVAVQMRYSRFALFRNRNQNTEWFERADRLLERVGLADRRERIAHDLAHGEQRCLEVAMALACEPKLLLLDEPTAGMSPEETTVMMRLIRELAAERTVILVEHKMKLVMGLCDRIIVLHHGELLAEGTPDAIRNNADVKRVYLGQSAAH
jgi:branched-chain amino acid transport system ATP-binding protein